MQKKILIVVVIAALIFTGFFAYWFNESNHNPVDYARITDVEYRAVVVDEPGSDGKVIVTERLTFDIHAASRNNLFWELWRDLPEEYIDGVKTEYKVNSVKQIFDNGTSTAYEESPRLYWEDYDFTDRSGRLGPGKWYHSGGPYNENMRRYECVFFYVDGLYRENVVFEIEYERTNSALRYNDSSELYLIPYSESDILFLQSFTGEILIPNAMMPSAGNYDAYTYGTNAESFPFTESDTANPGYHTFSFALDESQLQFKPYNQYIEFSMVAYGEDKHSFTQYASVNDFYHDDVLAEYYEEHVKHTALPQTFMVAKIIVLLLSVAIAVLAILLARSMHKTLKKRYRLYEPEMQMHLYNGIPSDLDPNFAATLVFSKHKPPKDTQDGYSAVLLSLVRKGYIDLAKIQETRDWDFGNAKIVVKYRPATPTQPANMADMIPLSPTEEQYFNLILRHAYGFVLPLTVFQQRISQDYEFTNAFINNTNYAITKIGVTQGYFQKADYKQPAKQVQSWALALGITGALFATAGNIISYFTRLDLAFGAFFILGIGFIAGAVVLNKQSRQFVLLTQFGENEYAKWRGLYNYLNSATFIQDCTVTDLATWEYYLIYATAFGIAEKVTAALNVKCPYANMSPMLRNPYYRSRHFHVHHRHHFRSATRTASRTARINSGGYGGFGGGRGGGGGGGGH